MAKVEKEPVTETVSATKKKIVRCDKTCTYVGSFLDAQQCKNRCSREVGHFLNCKCRTHEMQ